ncbi:hypothetical protein K474DRAFT_1680951, partial [Panus rudis PR-1116 ss-1]
NRSCHACSGPLTQGIDLLINARVNGSDETVPISRIYEMLRQYFGGRYTGNSEDGPLTVNLRGLSIDIYLMRYTDVTTRTPILWYTQKLSVFVHGEDISSVRAEVGALLTSKMDAYFDGSRRNKHEVDVDDIRELDAYLTRLWEQSAMKFFKYSFGEFRSQTLKISSQELVTDLMKFILLNVAIAGTDQRGLLAHCRKGEVSEELSIRHIDGSKKEAHLLLFFVYGCTTRRSPENVGTPFRKLNLPVSVEYVVCFGHRGLEYIIIVDDRSVNHRFQSYEKSSNGTTGIDEARTGSEYIFSPTEQVASLVEFIVGQDKGNILQKVLYYSCCDKRRRRRTYEDCGGNAM